MADENWTVWAESARRAQEAVNELGAGPPAAPQPGTNLTDDDRLILARAGEIGPALRASGSDRDRLAGWLLAEMAGIIARLDGAQPPETGHENPEASNG